MRIYIYIYIYYIIWIYITQPKQGNRHPLAYWMWFCEGYSPSRISYTLRLNLLLQIWHRKRWRLCGSKSPLANLRQENTNMVHQCPLVISNPNHGLTMVSPIQDLYRFIQIKPTMITWVPMTSNDHWLQESPGAAWWANRRWAMWWPQRRVQPVPHGASIGSPENSWIMGSSRYHSHLYQWLSILMLVDHHIH